MRLHVAQETTENRFELGGRAVSTPFHPELVQRVNAVCDRLIPPEGDFPAPSDVGIVDIIGRYVAPDDEMPRFFPFFTVGAVAGLLEPLGDDFESVETVVQDERMIALEIDAAQGFAVFRMLTNFCYYSRPAVALAVQKLPAGKYYRPTPQPYGYLDTVADWDEIEINRTRGSYVETADVAPVDLSDDIRASVVIKEDEA
jgi:hypothetical protein